MKNVALTQLILALLFLAAAIGGYVLWFFEVQKTDEQAAILQGEIAAKTDAHARSAEERLALSDLAEDEAEIASHFVKTDDIVAFLESLEQLGSQFGADISVVSVSDAVEGRITLSLSISGSFDAVMRALGAIEYGPYGSGTKLVTLDTGDDGVWIAAATLLIAAPKTP